MHNIITRDLIADYINYDGYSKHDLCRLINRWKRLLVAEGAKKGTGIGIGIFDLNQNHIALLFAAAELGLELTVLSKPISLETVRATKQMQVGLPEIMVIEYVGAFFWPEEMVKYYESNSVKIIPEAQIDTVTDDSDVVGEKVYPSDTYLVTSTSGTTGKVKRIEMSHETVLKWASIPLRLMRYSREYTMMHNVNMHHSAALTAAILPGLMVVENNYYGMIQTGKEEEFITDYVIGRGVKTMMANNIFQIDRMIPHIEKHKDKFTHKLEIFIGGFKAPDILYDYAKDLPVTFWASYGTTEHGLISWFVIDDKTENIPYYVGELVDWISIDFVDETAYITCDYLGISNSKLTDKIELVGNSVFYKGRTNELTIQNSATKELLDEQFDYILVKSDDTQRKYIVLWNTKVDNFLYKGDFEREADAYYQLDKETFTVENKISYGELLLYLDNRYEEENNGKI